LFHHIGKIEQSQQVGNVASRLVNDLADFVLGMAVPLDQLAVTLRLLDRVQILALNILDQRELGHRRPVDLADDRGDGVKPRPLGGAPAALAGDDLEAVSVETQQYRLEHSALGDRLGELVDRFLAELGPRLVGIGPDAGNLDLAHPAARLRLGVGRRPRRLAKQRLEAHPEAHCALAHHAASASCGKRAISSRARRI
jgi:hypothetical protein